MFQHFASVRSFFDRIASGTITICFNTVPVSCNDRHDTLRLLPSEKQLELRIYSDWTFVEAFFQKGRVAMTAKQPLDAESTVQLTSNFAVTARKVNVYPIRQIWTSAAAVREAPRVYN